MRLLTFRHCCCLSHQQLVAQSAPGFSTAPPHKLNVVAANGIFYVNHPVGASSTKEEAPPPTIDHRPQQPQPSYLLCVAQHHTHICWCNIILLYCVSRICPLLLAAGPPALEGMSPWYCLSAAQASPPQKQAIRSPITLGQTINDGNICEPKRRLGSYGTELRR